MEEGFSKIGHGRCGRWSHDLCRCQVKDAYRKLVLIHHPDKKAALLGACVVAQRRSKKNCQCGPEPHSFIVSSLIHPPPKKKYDGNKSERAFGCPSVRAGARWQSLARHARKVKASPFNSSKRHMNTSQTLSSSVENDTARSEVGCPIRPPPSMTLQRGMLAMKILLGLPLFVQ